jgi:RNA polymerase sigma-32 factor
LARLAGFEPAAYGLEVRCSIQLSYRRTKKNFLTWFVFFVHIKYNKKLSTGFHRSRRHEEIMDNKKKNNLKNRFLAETPGSGKSGRPERKPSSSDKERGIVEYDPLQRYLSEISRYRLLTRDEEIELGKRVQEEDDTDAAYVLSTANLRLVVKIALEFQRIWMQNLLDLIQEGNIGLMQAVQKFDPYKNVKFSYYASFWIKAYILKFIMDNWRLVKIGTTQGQRKLFFKLKKEKQWLTDQGFDPHTKLLSERLGVTEQEITEMEQRLDGWDLSLDAPLREDSNTERGELLNSNDESIENQMAKKQVEQLLREKVSDFRSRLTDRELDIFDHRIFTDSPLTLQDIGDKYQISRERVRQLEKNIVKKMTDFFKSQIPDFDSYEL